METAPLAGDGAWRERAQQLERDFQLLQEDTRALSRAFEGAAADLAFQQECQECVCLAFCRSVRGKGVIQTGDECSGAA